MAERSFASQFEEEVVIWQQPHPQERRKTHNHIINKQLQSNRTPTGVFQGKSKSCYSD